MHCLQFVTLSQCEETPKYYITNLICATLSSSSSGLLIIFISPSLFQIHIKLSTIASWRRCNCHLFKYTKPRWYIRTKEERPIDRRVPVTATRLILTGYKYANAFAWELAARAETEILWCVIQKQISSSGACEATNSRPTTNCGGEWGRRLRRPERFLKSSQKQQVIHN